MMMSCLNLGVLSQPLVLDLHSMCTKYSPHRLRLPCTGRSGNGPVTEAVTYAPSDMEAAGSSSAKAHFHLYEVTSQPRAFSGSVMLVLSHSPTTQGLPFCWSHMRRGPNPSGT